MTVDGVTLEVLRNGLSAVAEEMNASLTRTAFSPNIKERRDCSCALFDANGAMITQAENIPVHLGAMPSSVAEAIRAYPIDALEPGDGILLNDPFRGGAHLPDLTLISPIFIEDELLGFAANRAHHADIGGAEAGSVAASSRSIYEEGLRIPPVRFVEEGTINEELMAVVEANTRAPRERRGDLRAQRAANEVGVTRAKELVARHGLDTVEAAVDEFQAYSERRMRSELESIPDGTYHFQDVIEDDGRGNEGLPIAASIHASGDTIEIDFSGSAAQTVGAVNAVRAVTLSACYYAMRAITDPDIPPNAGCYRPITVESPEGSIVNATAPAAVVGGNLETSQRIVDVIFGALSESVPDRVMAASQGTMNNLTFGGIDPRTGEEFAFYETQPGGFGARTGADGMDGVQVHMTNTLNTPIEVIETAYPLRVRTYALRPNSGGAGRYRGGLGVRKDFEVLTETSCSVMGERRRTRPFGIMGGECGTPGNDTLVREGQETPIPSKSSHTLEAGTVVRIRTPGGGGYGDPDDRPADEIDRDRRLGKVTEWPGDPST